LPATPTVLLGLFTGGAHCCFVVRSYHLEGGSWVSTDKPLGDVGAELRTVDRVPLLVTVDSAFAYKFTDYAESGLPVVALEVSPTRTGTRTFVNVTRAHRSLIAADARSWWQRYTSTPRDPLGLLAAYAADECVLGHGPRTFATLSNLDAQGRLTAPDEGDGWPVGGAYLRALRTFLTQRGYCPAASA
jgi:hypothetical protein